jgi:2-polyprenyl-6-methoxyphenol hydroxylase-like FAD-dependent oxidoreductase
MRIRALERTARQKEKMSLSDIEAPVLIVGGSLVGMSTALLLAHHGVPALMVEQHRGTAIHPRAALINQRTMEIFRTVGVEQVVMRKSDEQFDQDGAVMSVETLTGREIAYFIPNLNEGVRDVSPTMRVFITQSLLEPLLKARAEELGARLRFGTEMVSFEQDADGVTALIRDRDSGKTSTVHARYLVGADGPRSVIRQNLGISMRGRGVFSNSATIYFRANVAPLLRGRNLSIIMVVNPTLRGFFRIEKPYQSGFLAVNTLGNPDHPDTDVTRGLNEQRSRELVQAALGTADVPVTIENVMPWQSTADVADSFTQGRVFLAGDAAHVMPPFGGFGGNTGIADAHNLAWKLAMVVQGKAGPTLLASYEPERRPVAAFTVEQAYSRYVTRSAQYLGTTGMQKLENDLNIELGYCYRSGAVLAERHGASHENPRESKGRPGTRAPHLWIELAGQKISTLDLFGKNFVLAAGAEGRAWCVSAQAAAGELTINLDVHRLEADAFPDAYGITRSGAVLVRPDGFVAWRAQSNRGASSSALIEPLRAILKV